MIRLLLSLFLIISWALHAEELHEQRSVKLSEEQDELQADTATLINGQTNEKVTVLLNKCRDAMEDAIDGLEAYDTGGKTLAAQTDVIELIYQAAKAKTACDGDSDGDSDGDGEGSGTKPGSEGMMEMMRQMLGMGNGAGGKEKGSKPGSGEGKGSETGSSPGKGADGSSDAGSTPQTGLSNPNAAREERVVPKSMGGSDQEIPSEFQEALNAYNKSLQR